MVHNATIPASTKQLKDVIKCCKYFGLNINVFLGLKQAIKCEFSRVRPMFSGLLKLY